LRPVKNIFIKNIYLNIFEECLELSDDRRKRKKSFSRDIMNKNISKSEILLNESEIIETVSFYDVKTMSLTGPFNLIG